MEYVFCRCESCVMHECGHFNGDVLIIADVGVRVSLLWTGAGGCRSQDVAREERCLCFGCGW